MTPPAHSRLRAAVTAPRTRRAALDLAFAVVLFWGAHAVYRSSTGYVQNCDSAYSLVVAEKLLTERTFDLSACIPADPVVRRGMFGYDPGTGLPYQLVRRANPRRPADPPAIYYGYPLGSTLLSLPFVEYYGVRRGLSTLHPDGRPNLAVEELLQLRVAARVSAAVVAVFYLLARFFGPPPVAFLVAAGFAVGSPVWSTLSRALWSHTWMAFCVSVAVLLLVARTRVLRRAWAIDLPFGVLIGTALFWSLVVRPHAVCSAAAVGAYLLARFPRTLLVTLAAGGAWSAAFVVMSLDSFGMPTPPSVYAAGAIDGRDVANRFAWLMASPSRGLLVYCPYLAVVAVVLVGYRKHLRDRGLLRAAGLAVAGHTALFACYDGWHGGSSYGPRYFCDLLPWFVLATAVAVRAVIEAPGSAWRKWLAAVALVAAFAWGGFVHSRGANAVPAWLWNARSLAVGQEAAVKEWDHPQFLAGLTFRVKPDGSVTTAPPE